MVDGAVAIDAGSLALGATSSERAVLRDVVVTHAHIDHIATLPLYVDDLFSTLERPVVVHALPEVISVLEGDVFNDRVYPRFHQLSNAHGPVLRFQPLTALAPTRIAHLTVTAVPVSHSVPTCGLLVDDGTSAFAYSSDTTATDAFWAVAAQCPRLKAVLLESAFPDAMAELARKAGHLTPKSFRHETQKLGQKAAIWAVNVKPLFREAVAKELDALGVPRLEPGTPLEL